MSHYEVHNATNRWRFTQLLKFRKLQNIKMTSTRRILEDIIPIRIIREVEKWPVIYKRDNPEMSNPHFKHKIWVEVAKNLFDNFEKFSATEKEAKVSALIKKWRNLRDTFKRQLTMDKKVPKHEQNNKKKYVYFKHMLYLIPHMYPEPAEEQQEYDQQYTRECSRTAVSSRRKRQRLFPSPGDATPSTLEHIDEDKHFLLSLMPSLKRMNEDEKLTAKMNILKVIKDVKNNAASVDPFGMSEGFSLAPSDTLMKTEASPMNTEVDHTSLAPFDSDDNE